MITYQAYTPEQFYKKIIHIKDKMIHTKDKMIHTKDKILSYYKNLQPTNITNNLDDKNNNSKDQNNNPTNNNQDYSDNANNAQANNPQNNNVLNNIVEIFNKNQIIPYKKSLKPLKLITTISNDSDCIIHDSTKQTPIIHNNVLIYLKKNNQLIFYDLEKKQHVSINLNTILPKNS